MVYFKSPDDVTSATSLAQQAMHELTIIGTNVFAEMTGNVAVRATCVEGMWTLRSCAATTILALAVCSEVWAGIEMKRSNGFENIHATARAIVLTLVRTCCCIQVTEYVELSMEWAMYTVFELTGIALASVIVWGEVLTKVKVVGLFMSLVGSVLLEYRQKNPGEEVMVDARCAVTLNTPLLGCIVFSAMVIALLVRQLVTPEIQSEPTPSQADGAKLSRERTRLRAMAGLPCGIRCHGLLRVVLLYGALIMGAICEIFTALSMKDSRGFRNLNFTLAALFLALLHVVFHIVAVANCSLAVAWTLGTTFEYAGVLFLAVTYFGESVDAVRGAGLGLTIIGVVLLVVQEEEEGRKAESHGARLEELAIAKQ